MTSLAWGVDLGGTKIEGVVTASPRDIADVRCRERIATEGERGYEHVIGQIETLVARMVDITGETPQRIGFGTPGTLDPATALMRGCNSTHLNHRPLGADLEQRLGVPVRIANDANCFTLAETRFGAARPWLDGDDPVFGIILGTGVGGGVVMGGKALYGRHGITGEWGHSHLDDSGGPCFCGRTGCLETVLSGPALEEFYARRAQQHRTLSQIESLAREGDVHARDTIERLLHFLAVALGRVVNILDPAAIVIGGGVGNMACIYEQLPERLAAEVFTPNFSTPILRPELGDSAGVFGAASLWQETDFRGADAGRSED